MISLLAFLVLTVIVALLAQPQTNFPLDKVTLNRSFFGDLLGLKKKPVVMVATGDVMLGRSVNAKMRALDNWQHPFLKTAHLLKSADLTFINLESPFADNCPTTNEGMIFCADPRAIEGLLLAGIDIVSLANNHARNYGQAGLDKTTSLLKENGLHPVGEGESLLLEVEGIKFGFLAFNLTGWYAQEEILTLVEKMDPQVDVLVVSFHWGVEYASRPSDRQVALAHRVVESGADLILGHHPHVIQPVEEYLGATIVYSLGNFVFDQPWSEATKKGLVGIFTFENKKLVQSEFKEIYIEGYSQPRFVN